MRTQDFPDFWVLGGLRTNRNVFTWPNSRHLVHLPIMCNVGGKPFAENSDRVEQHNERFGLFS